MKYLIVLSCLFFYFASSFAAPLLEQENAVSWKEVVNYAKENLPLTGQLAAKPDGFVYLKVDDAYIHTLFPMIGLQEKGYSEPPYFRSKTAPGAHVTVFYVTDHVFPKELGQTFHFELDRIKIVKSRSGKFVVLQIRSPELEKLREKYGLLPKLHGHEFHITLGKKS